MTTRDESSFWRRCTGTTQEDRRNQLRFAAACLVWALTLMGCAFLLRSEMTPAGALRWLIASIPTLAGLLLVAAFVRFLRDGDEFQRMVQLQSIGIGFAAGFLTLSGYPLFVLVGAPPINFADVGALMPIFYAIGIMVSWWRYR